jgi:hypothetical protein
VVEFDQLILGELGSSESVLGDSCGRGEHGFCDDIDKWRMGISIF